MDAGLRVQLPNNLFKLLEYSNQQIGLIGGLGLIGSLRFLFAPWLDAASTKRRLSLFTLLCGGALSFTLAAVTYAHFAPTLFFWLMVGLLFCLAIAAATYETAADGYYIRALDPDLQAQFIGIKTAAIRLGIIAATTGLLLLATRIAASYGAVGIESTDKSGFHTGFAAAFALAGIVLIAIAIYNKLVIPKIHDDQPVHHGSFALGEVFRDYFRQDRVILIIAFILLYRFGEGFLAMKYPFYLDARDAGGLAIPAASLAWLAILAEMPWMMIGGILGGFTIKWLGLRRVFIPMALAINVPNLLYYWLALTQPTTTVLIFGQQLNTALLIVSSLEAFFYGLSFSAMF
jgi:MFS transporter, PAT family, beta-lactamase induction signal transducer AmpG